MIVRAFLLSLLMAVPGLAQQAPIVETTLDQPQTIPGQPVMLRVTVLVPSWMLSPPEFPSFEAPNLRVLAPSRSSTSISRQIDGQTWSGVTRRFLLVPLVQDRFSFPAQPIGIAYADSDGVTAIRATASTDAFELAGVVPDVAADLDPFIAATDLTLTQELTGIEDEIEQGASLRRVITAQIDGSSPMVLPTLIPSAEITGMRVYDDGPKVTESNDDGRLSGARIESQTLMAVGAGQAELPAISVEWYDLDEQTVKTSRIEAAQVSIKGNAVSRFARLQELDWRLIAALALATALGGALLYFIIPRIYHWLIQRRDFYRHSAGFARRRLNAAVRRRNYLESRKWLSIWLQRSSEISNHHRQALAEAMAVLGRTHYGAGPDGTTAGGWPNLSHAIRRAHADHKPHQHSGLAPLNPR